MRINSKSSLGLTAGVLATAASIPFLINKIAPEDKKNKALESESCQSCMITENLVLDNEKFNLLQSLLKTNDKTDKQSIEVKWTNLVHPLVRERLIRLYQAEKEDIAALKAGRITEKERKVKIAYTDFVPPGEGHGEDMGLELHLHVVKSYDDKLPDGKNYRIYVNEHWPINEKTGGLLPTEALRVRVQACDCSLCEKGAHKFFVTDMVNILWGTNTNNFKYNAIVYPYLYRQNFYGDVVVKKDKETGEEIWENNVANTVHFVSNPLSCVGCHTPRDKKPSSSHSHSHKVSTDTGKLKDGSITLPEDFLTPYNEHPGYKKYEEYLMQRVKNDQSNKAYAIAILKDLMDSTNMENPFIVEALKESKTIPWVGEDTVLDRYDGRAYGFTYQDGEKTYVKAGFNHFKDNPLYDLGLWWFRENAQLIPRNTNVSAVPTNEKK